MMEFSLNGGDLKAPLISSSDFLDNNSTVLDEEVGPTLTNKGDHRGGGGGAAASKHSIGLGALVFLIYYNIGVPFGDEEAVKAAGPFMVSLAFFIILPIMWQIPICLVTAELTTTFQDHRGSIAWVSEAFGEQWGFVDAVWSLATSFLDNALYPIIIADFLGLEGALRWFFVYTAISALTWAVYRGSAVVASAEEAVFGLTMLPLIVMVGWGLFKMDWVAVTTPPASGDADWKLFIQIMFWTSTYWQKVASVGPEVKDCFKNFPRAIIYAAGMQTLINGILHLVAAGATDPARYPDWEPGYLRHAADAIAGGKWLGAWLTITAAVANSGSFLSEMSVTSQTLIGMAERGLLPKKIMDESQHGTHPWALAIIAGLIAVSQPLDFHALVLVCNFLYTLQTALELAAFYRLRTAVPGLHRPFRVPFGRLGASLAVALPAITLSAVTMTITMSAATFGSVIASATVLGAHFMFRSQGGIVSDDTNVTARSARASSATLRLPDDESDEGGYPNRDAGYAGREVGYPGREERYPSREGEYWGREGGYPRRDAEVGSVTGSGRMAWDMKIQPQQVGKAGGSVDERGFVELEGDDKGASGAKTEGGLPDRLRDRDIAME